MNEIKNTLLFKKMYGGLIGGAIGDSLGGPVEGMHYKLIRELYNGRLSTVSPYDRRPEDFKKPGPNSGAYARSGAAGSYTDDTYFQTLITKTIIRKHGRITVEDLAETWMREMDTSRAWYSLSNSYWRVALSRTPVHEAGAGNIPDNSSPMCIGTIGLINAGNPAQAALDAYDVASLSHDGHSRESASVIAAAVAEAVKPSSTVGSIISASMDYIPNKDTSLIYKSLNTALELAEKASDTERLTELFYEKLNIDWIRRDGVITDDSLRHSISVDPLEAVPCAISMFYKTGGRYPESVVASANYGRDCDTIACMTGYIAGAFQGIDGIPPEWVGLSISANPNPNLEELAVNLTSALLSETEKLKKQIEKINDLTK